MSELASRIDTMARELEVRQAAYDESSERILKSFAPALEEVLDYARKRLKVSDFYLTVRGGRHIVISFGKRPFGEHVLVGPRMVFSPSASAPARIRYATEWVFQNEALPDLQDEPFSQGLAPVDVACVMAVNFIGSALRSWQEVVASTNPEKLPER